jgi:hypothetical protein
VYRAFRLAERGDHVTEEEMDALLHQRGSSRCLSRAGGVVFDLPLQTIRPQSRSGSPLATPP